MFVSKTYKFLSPLIVPSQMCMSPMLPRALNFPELSIAEKLVDQSLQLCKSKLVESQITHLYFCITVTLSDADSLL